jgi:hypothetical protein
LLKIFAAGFYQVHTGMLLVAFIVLVGVVPPGQLLMYHKTLMLAFVSSPLMMGIVFALWLLYTMKSWHYVVGKLKGVGQHFLFYSANALIKKQQFTSWLWMQLAVLLPMLIYGGIAVVLGIANHLYLGSVAIILYLALLVAGSAALYVSVLNKLVDGNTSGLFQQFTQKWRKPYFSLFIYQVFNRLKLTWLITKGLSWIIITGVFYVFSDVRHDARVAGIAMLAVITAHVVLIFEQRRFEETWLSFSRNLPYKKVTIFAGHALVYLCLILPEGIWLFSRFEPLLALQLLLLGISTALLFYSTLYKIGLNMDVYLQWVLGLFIVLFWVIMFKLLAVLIILNTMGAFVLFILTF